MPTTPHEVFKKFKLVPHHELSEIFADQLGLSLFDGTGLRLEFAVARVEEPKPPAPPTGERHVVCRLVLSVPCAVDLINQMQNIGNQLAAAGLIKMEGAQAKPTQKMN